MIGRRVAVVLGTSPVGLLEEPGDYCGPVADTSWAGSGRATDTRPKVWFLLPCARDDDAPPGTRSVLCVATPPHVFRECADGSLEIRESIGVYGPTGAGHVWHGYLDEGHSWRQV